MIVRVTMYDSMTKSIPKLFDDEHSNDTSRGTTWCIRIQMGNEQDQVREYRSQSLQPQLVRKEPWLRSVTQTGAKTRERTQEAI